MRIDQLHQGIAEIQDDIHPVCERNIAFIDHRVGYGPADRSRGEVYQCGREAEYRINGYWYCEDCAKVLHPDAFGE